MSGQYDLVVAGGVESMTRVPLGSGRDLGSQYGPLVRERYQADLTSGDFADQLVPVPGAPGFVADEGLRRGTTPETLAKLKPSSRADGVIHAGNASQISDGASAALMATPGRAAELGLTPIARY